MWTLGHQKFPRIFLGKHQCPFLSFITLDQITEPVMRCINSKGCKCLIVKYLVQGLIYIDFYIQETPLWETRWIVAGGIAGNIFPNNTLLTNAQIAFIERIIIGKVEILGDVHLPYTESLDGKMIELFRG